MENDIKSQKKQSKGIALVITLSVMILLTVALSKTFQDTAMELKMIRHEEDLFLGRQVNRSFLRVFLFALKNFGANKVKLFIEETFPPGIPIPITGEEEDGLILNPSIESMDHYLNINGTYARNDDGPRNRDIIQNIISQNATESPPQYEVSSFIGQIADAIDSDQKDFYENFLRGQEIYSSEIPYFTNKNKKIDLITELKVLPAFQRLNLKSNDINSVNLPLSTINVSNKTCLLKDFNLNFLPRKEDDIRKEITNYLGLMEGIQDKPPCYYSELFKSSNSEAIVQMIAKKFNGINFENRVFKVPLSDDSDWETLLVSNFSFMDEFRTKMANFFTSRSSLIKIKYDIILGKAVFRSEAILHMDYGNKSDTDLPQKINILYFRTR